VASPLRPSALAAAEAARWAQARPASDFFGFYELRNRGGEGRATSCKVGFFIERSRSHIRYLYVHVMLKSIDMSYASVIEYPRAENQKLGASITRQPGVPLLVLFTCTSIPVHRFGLFLELLSSRLGCYAPPTLPRSGNV